MSVKYRCHIEQKTTTEYAMFGKEGNTKKSSGKKKLIVEDYQHR